jgi:hypothetical protein
MKAPLLFALVMLTALGACTLPPEPDSRFLPALEPFDAREPGWHTTRPLLLVADGQIHNLFAKPIPERNLSVDMVVGTAIRSPQLDMYSPDVLRWILENGAGNTEVILHLGDAIDLACDGEWRQFLEVMSHAGKPWLMVPGNHECYHFGTYDPRNKAIWQDAAYHAGSPITKDRIIRLYVAAILGQDDPGTSALAGALGLEQVRKQGAFALESRIPDRFEWEAPEGVRGYLEAVVWRIDRERPWRSFIVQRADLSGRGPLSLECRAILMDSCQYGELPALTPNAWDNYLPELNCGLTGELLADQLRIVRRWVEEARQLKLLVAHHPLNSIVAKSQSSLEWLWAQAKVGAFISGHTHDGHFEDHDLGNGRTGLEINVGSTSDWPMEWRTFTVFARKDRDHAYVKTDRYALVDVLKNRSGFFEPGWEIPIGAEDDYRKYRYGETSSVTFVDFLFWYHLWPPVFGRPAIRVSKAAHDTAVRLDDTMLWSYHRLTRVFPTDPKTHRTAWPSGCKNDAEVRARIESVVGLEVPVERKIDLIIELDRFEKSRATADPETGESTDATRLRYKISQAVWASRYESTGGRRLKADDQLIRVRISKREP